MDKTVKAIIKGHYDLAGLYRDLANTRCSEQDAYGVYNCIKESMAEETKARRLENTYRVEAVL